VAAIVGVAVLLAPAAYAHNSLASSTPANGAVLNTAPATVTLKFLAKLTQQGTTATIADPAGDPAGGAVQVNGATVTVPLHPTVAGQYTVNYKVASADGHTVQGKVAFTLTAAAVPAPAPSPSPSPTEAAPTTQAAMTTQAAVPASSTGSGGPAAWVWLVIAGAVLAGAVAVLLARRARMQRA
jgi:hypothetical protein